MASNQPHLRAGRPNEAMELTSHTRSEPSKEINVGGGDVDTESDEPRNALKTTSEDEAQMRRMGRNQQLVRHFRVVSLPIPKKLSQS